MSLPRPNQESLFMLHWRFSISKIYAMCYIILSTIQTAPLPPGDDLAALATSSAKTPGISPSSMSSSLQWTDVTEGSA